jgi:hypothetical protein
MLGSQMKRERVKVDSNTQDVVYLVNESQQIFSLLKAKKACSHIS